MVIWVRGCNWGARHWLRHCVAHYSSTGGLRHEMPRSEYPWAHPWSRVTAHPLTLSHSLRPARVLSHTLDILWHSLADCSDCLGLALVSRLASLRKRTPAKLRVCGFWRPRNSLPSPPARSSTLPTPPSHTQAPKPPCISSAPLLSAQEPMDQASSPPPLQRTTSSVDNRWEPLCLRVYLGPRLSVLTCHHHLITASPPTSPPPQHRSPVSCH